MGVNDTTYLIRTHLGSIIRAGDLVLGYDLQHTIMNDSELDLSLDTTPDVILVKKHFEKPSKPSGKKFRKKKRGLPNPSPFAEEVVTEVRSETEDAEEDPDQELAEDLTVQSAPLRKESGYRDRGPRMR